MNAFPAPCHRRRLPSTASPRQAGSLRRAVLAATRSRTGQRSQTLTQQRDASLPLPAALHHRPDRSRPLALLLPQRNAARGPGHLVLPGSYSKGIILQAEKKMARTLLRSCARFWSALRGAGTTCSTGRVPSRPWSPSARLTGAFRGSGASPRALSRPHGAASA